MTKAPSGTLAVHPLPYAKPAAHWFARLRHLPFPVLLASGDSDHPAARYDILAADPACVLRTRNETTLVNYRSGKAQQSEHGDPFAILARHCEIDPAQTSALPFTGGAIGYFGYELLHADKHIDHSEKPGTGLSDMLVGIYDWALVVDHQLQQAHLACRDMSAARQQELLGMLQGGQPEPARDFRLVRPFASNFTREQYLERYNKIIDYIHAGDCYQVNLAQCFSAQCEGDSWQAFQQLQRHANAPFSAYLEHGDQAVLSFSPERFIRLRDHAVLTQPIKGTRPRDADPDIDLANRRALETSRKDRAENLMIVDLLRNDLGKICEVGSVTAEKLFETQSFTNVHHLVSTIEGRLARSEDVFKLLAGCFPGGSITGTPKLRAMEIINELETHARSVYCGAIAYVDRSGNMDSNICIRTLVRSADQIYCWGGGGIVADSVGEQEYQETFDKISIFINKL